MNTNSSGVCDFSKIYGTNNLSSTKRDKNKFYFSDFANNSIEYKRKYVNDWSDLKEFAELDDIELLDNELTIVNLKELIEEQKQTFLKLFRSSMSGIAGLAYSN